MSGLEIVLKKLVISYAYYLVLTHPFFVLFSYGSQKFKNKDFGRDLKTSKKKITDSAVENARKKELTDKVCLGMSLWTGKPVYITDAMRQMHTLATGSTGVGKTESVLLPMLRHDIESGKGALIIDGKGDLELLAKIRMHVKAAGRSRDFFFFSLSHPEISRTYNPLVRGNASEIKDKLIGSTEWSEEFYKKKAEEALLTLLRPMIEKGKIVTFRELYYLLTDSDRLKGFKDSLNEGLMRKDLQTMENRFSENGRFLSGIIADLALITKSEFGQLVDVTESEIDLLRAYENNQICYFSLNTQGFEETAKRFGRMILQDIKTVSNEIQTQKSASERHFYGVYVDEFASFIFPSFMESLNKGRGAGLAFMMLHQSLGDLSAKRNSFQQQVLENTNIKIIMRQDDPCSIEMFAKIGGSKKMLIPTYQIEDRILGAGLTGVGSIREGPTFRIDPDLVRSLGRGEAILVTKMPEFKVDYIKLNHETDGITETMIELIQFEKRQAKDGLLAGRRYQTLEGCEQTYKLKKEQAS